MVEDTAVLVSSGPHQQANPVLSATGWNVDSKEAIEALLANGGNNFLATSGVATLTILFLRMIRRVTAVWNGSSPSFHYKATRL